MRRLVRLMAVEVEPVRARTQNRRDRGIVAKLDPPQGTPDPFAARGTSPKGTQNTLRNAEPEGLQFRQEFEPDRVPAAGRCRVPRPDRP